MALFLQAPDDRGGDGRLARAAGGEVAHANHRDIGPHQRRAQGAARGDASGNVTEGFEQAGERIVRPPEIRRVHLPHPLAGPRARSAHVRQGGRPRR